MGNSGSKTDAHLDIGEVIDSFDAKYVGSVPVKAPKGNDVCQEAVKRLLGMGVIAKSVDLKVTTNGIYVFDKKTRDALKEVPIREVSFVAQDPSDSKVISFFENDKTVRLITCHTFRLPEKAFRVPVAINDAFKILSGEMEAPSGDGKKMRRRTSKKDAIAASNVTHKGVDRGEELARFGGTFLGLVNVSKPKGDEVADEAEERIRKNAKPVPCDLVVYEKAFEVVNTKAGNSILLNQVTDISFARYNDDKTSFSFVLHDRRLDKMQCGLCDVVPLEEDQPSLRRIIDGAQRKMYDEAREEQRQKAAEAIINGKISASDVKDMDAMSQVIGVFEGTYMGAVPVKEAKGAPVVEGAIKKIGKIKSVPEAIFLQVSLEGIKIIGSLTGEVMTSFTIKDISYTSVTGKLKNFFVFIQRDESLSLHNCHIFKCSGERAFDIATCFGDAFKLSTEELKKSGGNPFAPKGEREAAPEHLRSVQVHRVDLIPRKPIGAGQFGMVYLADQTVGDGEGEDGSNKWKRAVKMLRGGASTEDKEEFLQEVNAMMDLRNENLVNIVGVTMQQRPWLMVLEFLEYGDLRSLLRGCGSKDVTLNYAEQLTFATGVANGMNFIAEQGYIHMDLAARNCLVGRFNHTKVADFGLTRKLPEGEDSWHSEKIMKLPVKWCAIESLDDRTFSHASDMWAFGVVLWEIMSYGAMPYGKMPTVEVQRRVREGTRLEKPMGCPQEYYDICKGMWAVDPADRPKFASVASELGTHLRTASIKDKVRDVGLTVQQAK